MQHSRALDIALAIYTARAPMSTVTKFTEKNFLKLNATKCEDTEVILFKKSFTGMEEKNFEVCENSFPLGSEARPLQLNILFLGLTLALDRVGRSACK